MTEPETVTVPAVICGPHLGVETSHHEVTLTGWIFEHGEAVRLAEYRLTPDAALHIAAQLVEHAASATNDIARDLYAGDCPTCDNTRLIVTDRHGQPWRENCPDCRARYNEALRPGTVPTISGWAAREHETFR